MNNTNQIYRQVLINLQQQKELKMDSDEFKILFNRQDKQKLNISGDKYFGAVDIELIGLNNQAKIKGIEREDKDAQVRFLAITDEVSTEMCQSMKDMLFYINKDNDFYRMYGETKNELRKYRIKCHGLVLGINLPPISHHWHWCRSTITYHIPTSIEGVEVDKKYNIFSSKAEKEIANKYSINKVKLDNIDEKIINNMFQNAKKVYKDFPSIEKRIKKIKTIEHNRGTINVTPDIKDNKFIMEINKIICNQEKKIKTLYKNDVLTKFHPKNTTYEDIFIHEHGHMALYDIIRKNNKNDMAVAFDWNNNITAQKIVEKAFNNLKISDTMTKNILRKNISTYATFNYGENIAEAFADYYRNSKNASILSKEIINVMKGMI